MFDSDQASFLIDDVNFFEYMQFPVICYLFFTGVNTVVNELLLYILSVVFLCPLVLFCVTECNAAAAP